MKRLLVILILLVAGLIAWSIAAFTVDSPDVRRLAVAMMIGHMIPIAAVSMAVMVEFMCQNTDERWLW